MYSVIRIYYINIKLFLNEISSHNFYLSKEKETKDFQMVKFEL